MKFLYPDLLVRRCPPRLRPRLIQGLVTAGLLWLSTAAAAGPITEGVYAAAVGNRDSFGYRFNPLTASLIAAKLHPESLEDTSLFYNLLPALSCKVLDETQVEYAWAGKKAAYTAELKQALSTAPGIGADFYSIAPVILGEYDASLGGIPFRYVKYLQAADGLKTAEMMSPWGSTLEMGYTFKDGMPVGPRAEVWPRVYYANPTMDGGGLNYFALNGTSKIQMSQHGYLENRVGVSSDHIRGSACPRDFRGAMSVQVVAAAPSYLSRSVIRLDAEPARQLLAKAGPQGNFMLLAQFQVTGSEYDDKAKLVWLKTEPFKYSLCPGTDKAGALATQCDSVIAEAPLESVAGNDQQGAFRRMGAPSWVAGEPASGASASGLSKTYTLDTGKAAERIGNGLKSLFKKAPQPAPEEAPEAKQP